ncbi:sigma 54-interacting response regulator [Pollutibacter soli]|uniref:sigma 54-interacting response regulator n=1 Tax=Pollutibacter soli TaxID=3034157 RepID=UPI0030135A4D
MNKKVLIVEDQFVEANDLQLMLRKAGYNVCGIARSVPIAQEMIKKKKPDIVLLDIFLKGKLTGIDLGKQLSEETIPFVYLSANSNEEVLHAAKTTQPYGFLVKPFREKDLLITMGIADYRHEHSEEANTRKETILKDKLLTIANSAGSWENKMLTLCTTLKLHISFDYITAGFNTIHDTSNRAISFLRIGYEEYQKIGTPELLKISGLKINELFPLVRNTTYDNMPAIVADKLFEQKCSEPSLTKLFSEIFQIRSFIYFPLHLSNGDNFIFCFYCKRPDTYKTGHIGLMNRLQKTMVNAIESMLSLTHKNSTGEINSTEAPPVDRNTHEMPGFESIIGKSPLLLNVFDLVTHVAYSDTSVLILGESGTGKERIADCIHNLSTRKGKAFVKVNCAALPTTLIESELFGHEKGSFTGATDKRIGKFSQANGGTIFLDEIGEMPVDLQVKLLRVLQEKEIEPIGGKSTIKINVRVIAATNRNLEKEVAEGRFRLDLYYRLNVFPIELPSLRERTEDIPALANHFINYYNRKAGKKIAGLSDKVLKNMTAYSWPGNIRELENLIERGVLLAKGTIIEDISIPISQKKEISMVMQDPHIKTILENERDYIITILKKCAGRIWGAGGAAEVLNVPPTTLKSKMKKLGIHKESME